MATAKHRIVRKPRAPFHALASRNQPPRGTAGSASSCECAQGRGGGGGRGEGLEPRERRRKPRGSRDGLGPRVGGAAVTRENPRRAGEAAPLESRGAVALASALLGRARRRAYWKRAGSSSRSMKSGSTRLRYCCQH